MKSVFFVTFLVSLIFAQPCTFQEYINTYGRDYTGEQREAREALFNQRIQEIEEFNSQNNGYTLKCTRWTDRFTNEMPGPLDLAQPNSDLHLTTQSTQRSQNDELNQLSSTDYLDWRDKNGVSSVKNQKQCGSCWSFATAAGVESLIMISSGVEYDLSEQYLLECSGSNSCNGGSYNKAWASVQQQDGLPLESQYPYRSNDSSQNICGKGTFKTINNLKVGVDNRLSTTLMNNMLNSRPLQVVVIADQRFLQYDSGVFKCSYNWTDSNINHAVQVVGYNITGNYYIVKNSWGTRWGMNGFGYIDMDSDCALKRQAWYITGTSSGEQVTLLFSTYHVLSIAALVILSLLI